MSKVTKSLLYSLAIISILGFIGIILNATLSFEFIDYLIPSLILIILGIGLSVEGQVRKWRSMTRNGLNSSEITHIVTGLVGIFAIIIGMMGLIGLNYPIVNGMRIIISSIAIIVIIIETWVVK